MESNFLDNTLNVQISKTIPTPWNYLRGGGGIPQFLSFEAS